MLCVLVSRGLLAHTQAVSPVIGISGDGGHGMSESIAIGLRTGGRGCVGGAHDGLCSAPPIGIVANLISHIIDTALGGRALKSVFARHAAIHGGVLAHLLTALTLGFLSGFAGKEASHALREEVGTCRDARCCD